MKDYQNKDEYEVRFDSKEIDISVKQFSLFQIIKRLETHKIHIDNYFQRRSDLWDNVKQSRFIESLLIRIPIPAFYFAEVEFDEWQVIDGLQRISTLKNFFIKKTLVLTGLEFLIEYNGCSVQSLPIGIIRRIEDSYITAYIINEGTPDQIKYVIFDRLNTGGLKLSSQEMRHALYRGNAITILYELASSDSFLRATDYSISPRRMADQEFANRFIAFYLGLENYDGKMETFLNHALEKLEQISSESIKDTKSAFYKSMTYSFQIFGRNAFRKNLNNQKKRTIVNKALFECVSINIARCSTMKLDLVLNNRDEFLNKFQQLLSEPKFHDSITSGTSKTEKVFFRFSKFNDFINNF